ncbi:hypothetical protein L596_003014 [Steinernema carpocapsae]|uniref:C2H2-type domain-containing protein n=1 Tax=Steinernema carpocapsae TaxID=34508 RepID=A0A4U8UST6_STECR|nr:hypothetical protein L596_003014 [Steinernema carpocapsae]
MKCKVTFDQAKELRTHMAKEHKEPFKCEICNYSHHKKYMISRHMRNCHNNKSIVCDIDGCFINFAKNKRIQHFRDFHPSHPVALAADSRRSTPRPSEDCEQSDDAISTYLPSTSTGTPEGSYERDLHDDSTPASPAYEFNSRNAAPKLEKGFFEIKISRSSDAPKDALRCQKCGKYYKGPAELTKHIMTVHEKCWKASAQKKRTYACTVEGCSRKFRTPQECKDHENQHRGGPPPYKCTWCEISYYTRRVYADHLNKAHNVSIKDL